MLLVRQYIPVKSRALKEVLRETERRVEDSYTRSTLKLYNYYIHPKILSVNYIGNLIYF